MNGSDSLGASFWLMMALQTIGSVDMPGQGDRKMPAPRSYLAIILAWMVLQLGSDAGYERAASVTGWIIVLTGMVTGPFGGKVISLFNNVVNIVSNSQYAPPGATPGLVNTPGGGTAPYRPPTNLNP